MRLFNNNPVRNKQFRGYYYFFNKIDFNPHYHHKTLNNINSFISDDMFYTQI